MKGKGTQHTSQTSTHHGGKTIAKHSSTDAPARTSAVHSPGKGSTPAKLKDDRLPDVALPPMPPNS